MWETPLRSKMVVRTEEGLLLKVLKVKRVRELEFYLVKVQVLGGPAEVMSEYNLPKGKEEVWNHIAPDRFVTTQIVEISPSLSSPPELDFFTRSPQLAPLH